ARLPAGAGLDHGLGQQTLVAQWAGHPARGQTHAEEGQADRRRFFDEEADRILQVDVCRWAGEYAGEDQIPHRAQAAARSGELISKIATVSGLAISALSET